MDIGSIGLWTAQRAWEGDEGEQREAIAEIDELGYGALWLGGVNDGLDTVSNLLERTKRLVVATGILNIWTHDAGEVAATRARLAEQYPDRLLIGLGSSHAPLVEPRGHSYAKPYSKLASFLDELDAATPPLPAPARVLAALGPRTLRLAGDRSAGAHPYLTTPEHTAQAREILGDEPLLAPEQKVVLETDPDRARGIARQGIEMYLQLPNYLNNLRRLGFTDADFADGGSDRLVDALVAWGDLDAVRGRVQQHRDAGADHVTLQALSAESGLPRAQWRTLAEAF